MFSLGMMSHPHLSAGELVCDEATKTLVSNKSVKINFQTGHLRPVQTVTCSNPRHSDFKKV